MAGPTIMADLCWQIAWFCPYDTLLELVRVSASTYHVTLPLLYNDITVSHRAARLVNSLATNSALPKLVKILEIMAPPDVRVDPVQWAAVLPAMCNLRWLTVCSSVSFPAHILPSITFRLITFGSFSTVVGDWVQLIASQPSIEELLFVSDFYAAPPSPRELPNLRVLRGRPADIARFSVQHPLEDLWFFRGPPFERRALKGRDLTLFAASPSRLRTIRISASQFLILLEAAPKLLTSLQHIVLDEEETWTDFIAHPSSRMHGSSLETFAAAANHRFPNLESVLLASVQHHVDPGRSRRLLACADGPYFASIMRPLFTAPHLKTFRVLAIDGVATWKDMVSDDVSYTEAVSIARMRQQPHLPFALLHRKSPVSMPSLWDGFMWRFGRVRPLSASPHNKPGCDYDWASSVPTLTFNRVSASFTPRDPVTVRVEFCGCNGAALRGVQLIAAHLVPSGMNLSLLDAVLRRLPFLFLQVRMNKKKKRSLLPRGVSPIWPPPASISSRRRSRAARKDTAPASLEPFTPTAEDAWQATMAELSRLPSQWAKGELDDENFQLLPTASSVQSPPVESCDVDDEYVDMPPLMASPDCVAQCFDTPFESSPKLLRLEEALQRAGRVDGETMERLSREPMELEAQESEFARKFKLARRAWEEQELREREIAREAALAYVVAAMREPDRRRWVEDGHRQEAMEAREAMSGLRWSPVLAGDVTQASWRDYSTGSGELEYVD
ncbi:hypothetical protein C8R47DRAFT_1205775 [Mycena vitilis]|nr:hypothetical protein C8R47DRAFT_1205775 [Mycena vitilis]